MKQSDVLVKNHFPSYTLRQQPISAVSVLIKMFEASELVLRVQNLYVVETASYYMYYPRAEYS